MPKATIKLPGGAIVTVEGSVADVADIAARFKIEHVKKQISKENEEKKARKKRAAASDLIIELRESGFFNKPKGLNDVAKALEEKGHLYPLTSLSGVMIDLVRARQLGRKKAGNGRWVYGK